MTPEELKRWLDVTAWDKIYWSDVKVVSEQIYSDGCSGVPNWMIWTCWEHDIHYRTHKLLNGAPITKKGADYILRIRMQQGSAFGVFYWRSWVRWAGVSWFPFTSRKAQGAWDYHGGTTLSNETRT